VRLLAVRDLNMPPWVDASRHALITAVMVENGQTPTDYAPYLPVDRFPYHFGFHTLSASLSLMSHWPLPQLLLVLGQLLNGLLPWMVYTAVWLLTRHRNTGLLAAFLVGLPFFFPAYYATWGRFTQLTAMLIMPVLLACTWLLLRGGRRWRHTWWLLALLIAGIFYVHFRVFLIYLPFVPIVWLMSRGRHTRWLLGTAVLALTLTLPRLLQLLAITEPAVAINHQISNYNAFPISYVRVGWETQFWWLAAVGLLIVLLAYLNHQRWTLLPMALTAWVALLAILLAGEKLGLPETSLLNLNSMYITLFVPLAIFLAILATHLWRHLKLITSEGLRIMLYLLLGAGITAVTLFGIRQQITIINPQTVLARPQDLDGLQWAKDNLPEDAFVAVNSWLWLGGTWAGADGGAWLVPLTGLSSSTPPADYNYDADLFWQVDGHNQAATAVTDWSFPEQADWLRQQGISHIFIGAKGGFFDPAALAQNPEIDMLYGRDGVFIFELVDE
jgi:hypothetical protein